MDVLILLGPKGAGKSTIAGKLASSGSVNHLPNEKFFLDLYESHDAFRADRDNAYRTLETEIRRKVQADPLPVLFEETAHSPQAKELIAHLRRDFAVCLVKVTADLTTLLHRVAERSSHANFAAPPATVRESFEVFQQETSPQYRFSVEIDTARLDGNEIQELLLRLIRQENSKQ